MEIKSVNKSRTMTVVNITGTDGWTDRTIRKAAFEAAGESLETTFGYHLSHFPGLHGGTTVVDIYTD